MSWPPLPAAGAPAGLGPPPDTRLPDGFAVELAGDVHRSRDGRLMLGGSPPRLLRLSGSAARLLEPGRFTVADAATARLARRLVDIGVALPRPAGGPVSDVTIVIPVCDRAFLLHRLLTALRADPETAGLPVLVVDDGVAYIGNAQATVRAISMRFGTVLWSHDTPHAEMASSPAVVGDEIVYHAMDGHVTVLDRATGHELWSFDAGSPIESSPIVRDGVDYFFVSDGEFDRLVETGGLLRAPRVRARPGHCGE